jgi:hypothetical protein
MLSLIQMVQIKTWFIYGLLGEVGEALLRWQQRQRRHLAGEEPFLGDDDDIQNFGIVISLT